MIAVILVNYNNWEDTIECVASILESDYTNYKVIVVDNDSVNDSVLKMKEYFTNSFTNSVLVNDDNGEVGFSFDNGKITVLCSKVNGGFSAGNNIGISYAIKHIEGLDYCWLLNNDTVILKNTLGLLFYKSEELRASRKIGILGAKLLYYYTPNIIQSIGGVHNKFLCFSHSYLDGCIESDSDISSQFKPDFIVGASMFVCVDFIKDVGLLCEEYFLYFEELDWVTRGRRKGWDIDSELAAKVYHKEGGATTINRLPSEKADICMVVNRLLFTSKFYKVYLFTVIPVTFLSVLNRIRRGYFTRAFRLFIAIHKMLLKISRF